MTPPITDKELGEWERQAKDNLTNGPFEDGFDINQSKRLISLVTALRQEREKVKQLHIDMSAIRRATDDILDLKDINRMSREALAKVDKMNGEK